MDVEQVRKDLQEAYEQSKLANTAPLVLPPNAKTQVKSVNPRMITVDTSQSTRKFLDDLRKSLEDNMAVLQNDLKKLADEYKAREDELDRIFDQVEDLKTCIEALDNEDEG